MTRKAKAIVAVGSFGLLGLIVYVATRPSSIPSDEALPPPRTDLEVAYAKQLAVTKQSLLVCQQKLALAERQLYDLTLGKHAGPDPFTPVRK